MRPFTRWTTLFLCLLAAPPASAQNWNFDARRIGLGGVGDAGNVATEMVNEQRPYRAIVLPFGLFQVLPKLGRFNPSQDDFDLVRAVEYAASPIHYVVGRDSTDTGERFVTDIRNATLSRDLNDYRGFVPANTISAEGLASPSWGGTIKFSERPNGAFQGIYVGAGPYLSMQTAATIDPNLTTLLASASPVYVANTSYHLGNDTVSQTALAVTGGYRARVALDTGGGPTDGLYIGGNFHFLRGFHYEDFNLAARLDTDNVGLVTVNPALGVPLAIARDTSTSGRGLAVDVGVAAVVNGWEVGFGVNGIANRMDWTTVERTDYLLTSLLTGTEFIESPARTVADARVELPVDVRANAGYNADMWSAITEFGRGFNGSSVRAGFEQRVGRVQLRGGGRYVKERFEPAGGIGFNFSDGVGIDVAAFGTSANLERKRHLGLAASVRLARRNP